MPPPGVAHDRVEIRPLRHPPQRLADARRRCVQHGRIAGAPRRRSVRHHTTREWAASAILDYLTQNVDHCLYSYRTTEFHSDFFLCQKK